MYDNRYMSHIVGSRKVSIFLTKFFSSSGVQEKSLGTSICLVECISLLSAGSRDWRVDGMVFRRENWSKSKT